MSSRARLTLGLAAAGLSGMLVAVQSRANGGLAVEIGSGYVAAAFSVGSGLVLLFVALAFSRSGRQGFSRLMRELRSGRFPRWALLGGLVGGLFVLAQSAIAPLTGLALFTIGVVVGQVCGGLILDIVGIGPGGRIAASVPRVAGTVLAVVGVIVSVLGGVSGDVVLLVVVPILLGVAVSAQSMSNGLIRSAAGSALTATIMNFTVGFALLLVLALVSIDVQGWPSVWPSTPWYYIGGPLGIVFVGLSAILVRPLGVLLLSMSSVAGQLLAAALIEAGLPLAGGLTPWMVAGCAITLAAVAIATAPGRSSDRSRGGSRGEAPLSPR